MTEVIPVVEDDGMHIQGAPGMTLCQQLTDRDTIIGTRDELRADRGGACWTCEATWDATASAESESA